MVLRACNIAATFTHSRRPPAIADVTMYFGTMTVFEIYISYRFAIKHLANFQCLTEVLQILMPAFRSRYFGLAMQLTVRRNAVASNTYSTWFIEHVSEYLLEEIDASFRRGVTLTKITLLTCRSPRSIYINDRTDSTTNISKPGVHRVEIEN